MKHIAALITCALLGLTHAASSETVTVPREKISLACKDSYFKTERLNFLLRDEDYISCRLSMPLALRDRWPGQRTYYVVPRVSASLRASTQDGKSQWIPLPALVNPGSDPFHRAIEARNYKTLELVGQLGKLSDKAGKLKPDVVSAGGKVTVCAAPVYKGEQPCVTFDVTARFKVYLNE